MLVLTRKPQEKIRIGDNIVITVLRTKGKAVRLGIEAPNEVPVLRGELAFDDSPVGNSSGNTVGNTVDEGHATDCTESVGESASTIRFERVSRDVSRSSRTAVIAPLATDGGPLRAMLNNRVVAR